ncbi:MAG: CHAD domain-containing protein [Acidobacteria bacterium]|nr:CHAD domain-containing protein [Acidobacteriota bacterium]
MSYQATPETLFTTQIHELSRLLPEVRESGVEAIHGARVASRRVREVVPLMTTRLSVDVIAELESMFKKTTRALRRARDRDVMIELLSELERHMPEIIASTAPLRIELERGRDRLMRKTLKKLDRLDVEALATRLSHRVSERARILPWRRQGPDGWRETLRTQVGERAEAAREAIGRAGGVYFPNRLHAGRVSLKKLRYSAEIATATGLLDALPLLRPLKKAQELLGRIHDRDVLAQYAEEASDSAARAVVPVLEMQRRQLHQRYLRRRHDVMTATATLASLAVRSRRTALGRTGSLIVASAAVPVAWLALRPVTRVGTEPR